MPRSTRGIATTDGSPGSSTSGAASWTGGWRRISAQRRCRPIGCSSCMDAAGVDAAVVVSPTLYAADTSYVRHTVGGRPGAPRVRWPRRSALRDARPRRRNVAGATGRPRDPDSVYLDTVLESLASGRLRDVLVAAERHEFPSALYPAGLSRASSRSCGRSRGSSSSSITSGWRSRRPRSRTSRATGSSGCQSCLRLAAYPNVAVKATGLPSLSREPYPFRDVWGPLLRVVEAFGCERVMWGTDFTRVAELATYEERCRLSPGAGLLRERARAALRTNGARDGTPR